MQIIKQLNFKKKIIIIFNNAVIIFLTSCNNHPELLNNALNDAEENKVELENVLKTYSGNPEDSLKYKAAVFLIENMPFHYSYKQIYSFKDAFDSINQYPIDGVRKEIFRKILDPLSKIKKKEKPELLPDIKLVSSKYLISNIELAFSTWYKIPKNERSSFADFCNFILPYKTAQEPIEEESRNELTKKYAWVATCLKNGYPLKKIVDSVTKEFNHSSIENMGNYFPQPLSISQVQKTRVGTCDDGVNYLINVFRSQGIIASKEMIPHWGNHHTLGHSWLFVKYGKQEYSTDVGGGRAIKDIFKNESIPKVMRSSYKYQKINDIGSCTVDVTKIYINTTDISIKNILTTTNRKPLLCVFDKNNEWKPIAFGKNKNGEHTYKEIGTNVLYLAGTLENTNIIPINYPFYIDKFKKIHFYNPSKSFIQKAPILRKYGLSSPRYTKNIEWLKNLNGGVFQVSNNLNFKNSETLFKISNFKSTQINKINLKTKKAFKYARFYSNQNESYLAKLAFFDDKGIQITGEIFEENNTVTKSKQGAFDNNPLTFSGGKNVSLGLKFDKPKKIKSIEFQVRNGNNHIKIGNQYELFYWDKKWKTLGEQIARDTVLYYTIPKNSLLWLKNYTEGNEEHVFTIDIHKKQIWLGFDN